MSALLRTEPHDCAAVSCSAANTSWAPGMTDSSIASIALRINRRGWRSGSGDHRGEACVQRRDRVGGVVHEYILAA
jgi:hypothetical protein